VNRMKADWLSDELIRDLYVNQGLPMHEIARQFGVCREPIRRRIGKMGIRTRNVGDYVRGKPLSPEHRSKISSSLTGYKRSAKEIAALSLRMKGRFAGDKHPNWRGGIKRRSDGYIMRWMPDHPRANKQG